MSTSVLFNGSTYTVPAEGESNWGTNVSNYLIAIASGSLQKTGGTFTLSSELDFGSTYGLKTPYVKSRATNPSGAGIFRLGNAESIGWRNAGNTADLLLKANSSDNLEYNGTKITLSGAIVNADIASGAAIDYSKLALIATDKVLISSGAGYLTASSVSATTLTYLDASSSIQTQLNGKEPSFLVLGISKGGTNSGTSLGNDKVMISSGGAIVESSTTTTSLGYLDATSSIQTQLNGKQASGSYALTTGKLNQFAATSSSELASVISDDTGSGSLVFSNSPTLVTPVLGAATGTSLALGSTLGSSAIADFTSTSLGFLEPRMTQTQRDAIASPATGLQVYNTTSNKLNFYNGTAWKEAGGVGAWAASTSYAVNDLVIYGQFVYSCITGHTSSSTMETDLAGTSPKWKIVNTEPSQQNLMTYGFDFECGDVAGWTAVGCATVTNGLLVSAGSGGAAFSAANGGRTKGANTTSPAVVSSGQLDGLYSLNFATSGAGTIGDMYISSTYKIPIAYQNTVLQVKFKYKVVSGTPVMAGTSSNTYACAIYDLDNNSWSTMALVGAFNFVQSSGVGTFTGTFQVPYNSTQFQIAIYNPVAPTGASSLYVDDFYVGPQITSTGPAISDWKSYTPTWSASVSNPAIGNGSILGFYRQVGDTIFGSIRLATGSTTTYGSGVYSFSLPSGLSIDISKSTGNSASDDDWKVGQGSVLQSGVTRWPLLATPYTTTTFKLFIQPDGSSGYVTGNSVVTNLVPITFSGSGNIIEFNYSVPITGWSSNTVMSSDTDTRAVACCVVNSGATTQTLTTTASKITTLNSAISDPTGMYDSTNDRIYAYVSGQYRVTSSLRAESLAAGRRMTGLIYHTSGGSSTIYDAGELANPDAANAVIGVALGNLILTMKAGDYVELYGKVDSGTTAAGAYSLTNLSLQRISGPAVIAATDSIIENWCDTAGGNITSSGNTVVFTTKNVSQTGSYNSSTGIFTAPVSGNYLAAWRIQTVAQSPSTSQSVYSTLQKNGSDYEFGSETLGNGTSILPSSIGSTTVKLLSGETCNVKGVSSLTAALRSSSTASNYFNVVRIGNY